MKKIILFICASLFINTAFAEDFTNYVNQIKSMAEHRGFSKEVVNSAFADVKLLPRAQYQNTHQTQILNTFKMYMDISVTPKRIALGKKNMRENHTILEKVSDRYHIPPQVMVALWGLETNYGGVTEDYPEFSALTTLAYQSDRPYLFKQEIFDALKMLQDKNIALDKMQGSWAGAMGQCQFMPSAYLLYAVAYEHKGPANIWNNLPDVFASIANYLNKEGWNNHYGLLFSVKLNKQIPYALTGLGVKRPISYWLKRGVVALNDTNLSTQKGAYSLLLPAGEDGPAYLANWNNFRVIMRWNNSVFYGITVGDLANKLLEK